MCQSNFSSKEEVANYFEGHWTLDMFSSWGTVRTIPHNFFQDSTTHRYEFIQTNMDSFPLLCKSFVDEIFFEEKLIEIAFEDDDGFVVAWRMKNLPNHLSNHVAVIEDDFFKFMTFQKILLPYFKWE